MKAEPIVDAPAARIAALALVGVWILTVLWVTSTAGTAQRRANGLAVTPDDRADGASREPGFSAADD